MVRKEYAEFKVLSIDEMGEKLTAYDFQGSTSFASGIKDLWDCDIKCPLSCWNILINVFLYVDLHLLARNETRKIIALSVNFVKLQWR